MAMASSRARPLELDDYFARLVYGPQFQPGEDMVFEATRLATFEDWPGYAPLICSQLAKAGFFYSGIGDEVTCFSCLGRIQRWEEGDLPMSEHKKFYPNCPFLKGIERRNVPLRGDPVRNISDLSPQVDGAEAAAAQQNSADTQESCPREAMPHERNDRRPQHQSKKLEADDADEIQSPSETQMNVSVVMESHLKIPAQAMAEVCDHPHTTPAENENISKTSLTNENTKKSPASQPEGVSTSDLFKAMRSPSADEVTKHREVTDGRDRMKDEEERRKTYSQWPATANVSPEPLTKAGFYYTGIGDKVQCAFCLAIVHKWDPGDIPMKEHALHSPNCSFVRASQKSGLNFLEQDSASQSWHGKWGCQRD